MVLTTLIGGNRESRTLTDGTYMIGRNPSCQIRFDFPDVSERHAVLTVRDGRAVVEDLHSANGTYVNGEPIDGAVVLDSGMVVQVGESMLRVCDENDWAVKAAEDAAQDEPAAGVHPLDERLVGSGERGGDAARDDDAVVAGAAVGAGDELLLENRVGAYLHHLKRGDGLGEGGGAFGADGAHRAREEARHAGAVLADAQREEVAERVYLADHARESVPCRRMADEGIPERI